jgi:hypothetical protein
MYKHRKLENYIPGLANQYPVLTITGPRQSGKTTLTKKLFPDYIYYSLEQPDIRRRFEADPVSMLSNSASGIIIDEVQRLPELLSYIQVIVDEINRPGQFIVTGSAQLELLQSVSQSLAGRTAIIKLLPFSFSEIFDEGSAPEINEMMVTGFYPRIFDMKLDPREAYSFYTNTYIERDVRSVLNIKDLSMFHTFLRLAAGRTGQVLNSNALSTAAGINHNTASSWLSVLEAGFIVYRLKPHHKNLGKRLIKSPKLYFIDTGIVNYLLEIQSVEHLEHHPLRGNIFETFAVMELLKQFYHKNKQPNIYYFRDNTGHEVDLIYDFGTGVFPVEIKSGKTVSDDYFKNLKFYMKINPDCKTGAVIYGGDKSWKEGNLWVISYKDIGVFEDLDFKLSLTLPD